MRKDVIEHGKVHFKAENEQKSTKRARFEAKSDLELQPGNEEGREQKALQQKEKTLCEIRRFQQRVLLCLCLEGVRREGVFSRCRQDAPPFCYHRCDVNRMPVAM